MQSDIKTKKKEARRARNFSKRFVSAIRNETISSIDREEAEDKKFNHHGKGEIIRLRAIFKINLLHSYLNIVNRICKSSRREEQPILWEKIARK